MNALWVETLDGCTQCHGKDKGQSNQATPFTPRAVHQARFLKELNRFIRREKDAMSQSKRKAWDATMQASGHVPTRKTTKRASGDGALPSFDLLLSQHNVCVCAVHLRSWVFLFGQHEACSALPNRQHTMLESRTHVSHRSCSRVSGFNQSNNQAF